jgi:hypothetical protein
VRLSLSFVRFQIVLRLLEHSAVRLRARQVDKPVPASRIAWAIDAASQRIPTANSCLPRALAARFLLVRWGYPAEFSIGVARNRDGKLEAHAWVEALGKVVIGASEPGYFSPLGASKAASQ